MKKQLMKYLSDEDFAEIIKTSECYKEVCEKIGLRVQGSNYKSIKRRISKQKTDISHFIGKSKRTKRAIAKNTFPLEELLIEDSFYSGGSHKLKLRLVKEKILSYECRICGNKGEWMGKPISLQLDHINGICTDNRIENLQILCPNCHTQTPTHSGKRLRIFK